MGKLHEILAVEQSSEKASRKMIDHSRQTFNKENLFKGVIKNLSMFDEDLSNMNTSEQMKLETTVDENFEYLTPIIAEYWDIVLQKDSTNQHAKSDLVVDGHVLGVDLPATFLLGLETKLGKLRELYEAIPTLPPGIDWQPDDNQREGVFVDRNPHSAFKTEKQQSFDVVVQPTEHHPAQIKEVVKNVNVGKYVSTQWCGMLTPVEKANRLKRLDSLLKETKKSRQKANDQEVPNVKIGIDLLNYING